MNTRFCNDMWFEEVAMCVRFRRMFDLVENKDVTTVEICVLGWTIGGEGWKWWIRLFSWGESMWRECSDLLSNIVLQDNVEDY